MKRYSILKLAAFITVCNLVFTACKNNLSEPDPLPNRLISIRAATGSTVSTQTGSFSYDDQGRILGMSSFLEKADYRSFTYNAQGQVSGIGLSYGSAGPTHSGKSYKINYENGLPVSGSMRFDDGEYKSPTANYYIDSVLYKTQNGLVTEITYLNRKYYYKSSGLQMGATGLSIVGKFTINYENGNLLSVNSDHETFDYTYGTKRSAGYANRMKFVLCEEDNPLLFSVNDLLSIDNHINNSWISNVKKVYAYQYNTSGFPISAVVDVTWNTGATGIINLIYNYQ